MQRLSSYKGLVEARLETLLPLSASEPRRLHEAMRYSALAPGKRLRPALCLAAAEAVGGTAEDALDAACALEFVHCFSLIHDDLPAIDNDDLRRGRPTCHKQFDEATAILAGDALFALAFEVVAASKAPHDRVAKSVLALAKGAGTPEGLVAGEVLDILSERLDPSFDLVKRIHEWKTGSLIAASCAIGAILGGGDDAQTESLRRFGLLIGLAFQIQDDILNETSTPEAMGKGAGTDKERGKQTYPAVLGLAESRSEARRLIQEADACLDGLPGDPAALKELAAFAASRSH